MTKRNHSVAAPLLALTLAATPGPNAKAQPATSLTASCASLRTGLEKLNPPDSELVTIDVVGKLVNSHFDGAIAYLALCEAPDPEVLCITYSIGDLKPGDMVMVSGGYGRPDADHVILDPCLPYPPSAEVLDSLGLKKVD